MTYAIVSSMVALMLGMKFTAYKAREHNEEYKALVERVVKVETYNEKHEQEMYRNVMTTVAPIAKAVQTLNREVGIK